MSTRELPAAKPEHYYHERPGPGPFGKAFQVTMGIIVALWIAGAVSGAVAVIIAHLANHAR